jgi:hypothetical protein
MSIITWVLILTGVGLNAAAQLLLKLATRPLGHFTVFNADTLNSSVITLFKSVPFWTGMVCYGASLCVWVAALAKAPRIRCCRWATSWWPPSRWRGWARRSRRVKSWG